MEENKEKVNCCEMKNCESCEKCSHCPHMCCGKWKKCHMIKKIVWIIMIIIAFCLGSQWGEMKARTDRDYGFERGGMMGWGYNRLNNNYDQQTGSVTVKVSNPENQPTTQAPAPKQ